MKFKTLFTVILGILLMTTVNAQENNKHLWKYGQNNEKTIGIYGGLSLNYFSISDDDAGFLGYRAGVVLNNRWAVGFAGRALAYEKHFTELSDQGSYRLEAGYAGMFIEYIVPVGKRFKISGYIISAQGIAQYKYHKDFTADMPWCEEIIDADTYGVFEPGAELQFRIGEKWWIGAEVSYRSTAPLELKGTDKNLLQGLNAGITLKLGIF
jgi:hypothetical protein